MGGGVVVLSNGVSDDGVDVCLSAPDLKGSLWNDPSS
jgi:hypothetical protein